MHECRGFAHSPTEHTHCDKFCAGSHRAAFVYHLGRELVSFLYVIDRHTNVHTGVFLRATLRSATRTLFSWMCAKNYPSILARGQKTGNVPPLPCAFKGRGDHPHD
jgi:hypothetical protein